MLCDSCLHVALDGDTVVRSTPLFDNLLEQDVKGTSLKNYVPSCHGETARLADAFTRARRGPVALPVTLISKQQVGHLVELFIVRRRSSKSDTCSADFGFLVGMRVDQGTTPGPHAWRIPVEQRCESNRVLLESQECDDSHSLQWADEASACNRQAPNSRYEPDQEEDSDISAEICIKNSFLCLQGCGNSPLRRASSAPPVLSRLDGRPCPDHDDNRCDQSSSTAQQTDWSFAPMVLGRDAGFSSMGHAEVIIKGSDALLSSLDSSGSSDCSASVNLKIAAVSQSVARLSDVLRMKSTGVNSIGSCRSLNATCTPCSFHFSHVRNNCNPKRPPCKVSYMCDYCHSDSHASNWRSDSEQRKSRRPPTTRLPQRSPLDRHEPVKLDLHGLL